MNRHLYSIPFLLTMLSSCSPDPLNPVAPYYQCTDYVSGACAPYLSSDPCPPAPLESCDGIDNDCNGEVDEQNGRTGLPCPKAPVFECLDYTTCERYSSSEPCPPEPSEVCDAVDNNCNGLIDE